MGEWAWGSTQSGSVNGTLGKPLTSGAKIAVDLKVDSFIPFKASCAVCGTNCTITIPIVKKTISFATPACPIAAGNVAKAIPSFTLPAKSPNPAKTSVKGTVTVTHADGSTAAEVSISATV